MDNAKREGLPDVGPSSKFSLIEVGMLHAMPYGWCIFIIIMIIFYLYIIFLLYST